MKSTLLLVIDMQNGFFDKKNPWYVKGAELIIPVVVNICSNFSPDNIIFARFVNLKDPKFKNSRFLPGTREIEIIEPLRKFVRPKNVFDKHGYSAFSNKKLAQRVKKSKKIYICGLRADACVIFTIANAYDMMLDFRIIIDAIAGFGIFKNSKNFKIYCEKRFGKEKVILSKNLKRF